MTNVTNKENNKRRQLSWDLSFTGLLILLLFRIPLTNIIGIIYANIAIAIIL